MDQSSGCPFAGHQSSAANGAGTTNKQWGPQQLNVAMLHQHQPVSSPLSEDFDYSAAFAELDYDALKADLVALMTDSQDW